MLAQLKRTMGSNKFNNSKVFIEQLVHKHAPSEMSKRQYLSFRDLETGEGLGVRRQNSVLSQTSILQGLECQLA